MLLGSGFVSGSETALTSLSSDDLSNVVLKYPRFQKSFLFWKDFPNRVLAMIQIGNSFFNIGLGVVAASLAINLSIISDFDKKLLLVIIPGTITIMILLFAEILPKIIARQNKQTYSIYSVGILVFFTRHLASFISFLVGISDKLIKWFGGAGVGDNVFLSSRELKIIFSSREHSSVTPDGKKSVLSSSGMDMGLATDTRQILRNILKFSSITVGEIMTPRTEMFAVNINDKAIHIMRSIYSQGYSRVPVYEKSIDNIVGLIYAKDLLHAWRNSNLILIGDLLRPVYFVPSTTPITGLLREFRTGKHHIAIIVDEYGGTAGLVTIEDALEEIIGEIYDEYDEKIQTIIKEKENSWIVQTSESLDKINEALNLDLPADKFENLASFLLNLYERVPKKGEIKQFSTYKFEIVEADKKRIYTIRIQKY
ncbi:MAG: hemolysin family protein [bacterium]